MPFPPIRHPVAEDFGQATGGQDRGASFSDQGYQFRTIDDAMPIPTLLIHGGAWAMPDDEIAAHENGVGQALAAGYAILERGGSSLDAVEAAIVAMEDDEAFDAGRGSYLTSDGRVQLDALLMNGENLRAGGVACVERLRNPIRAARLVLDVRVHMCTSWGRGRSALPRGTGCAYATTWIW